MVMVVVPQRKGVSLHTGIAPRDREKEREPGRIPSKNTARAAEGQEEKAPTTKCLVG